MSAPLNVASKRRWAASSGNVSPALLSLPMTSPPRWPPYLAHLGSHDAILAMGVISLNYGQLESMFASLLASATGIPHPQMEALFPQNSERCKTATSRAVIPIPRLADWPCGPHLAFRLSVRNMRKEQKWDRSFLRGRHICGWRNRAAPSDWQEESLWQRTCTHYRSITASQVRRLHARFRALRRSTKRCSHDLPGWSARKSAEPASTRFIARKTSIAKRVGVPTPSISSTTRAPA